MTKCHCAGFAVVGASVLVSATAIAGPPLLPNLSSPSLHDQYKYNSYGATMAGCEEITDGISCWDLSLEFLSFQGDSVRVILYEYEYTSTFETTRGMGCYLPLDTFDVAAKARAVKFEALIDIARDGCQSVGWRYVYSTGEWSTYEFPNDMSIHAYASDPYNTYSSINTGHTSSVNGYRENVLCYFDSNTLQNLSVEINGSPKLAGGAQASRNRCNTTVKN